jgi:hypothetical protein
MNTTLPALALLLGSLLPSPRSPAAEGPPDLLGAARADGRFTLLLEAVAAAGMEDALRGPGPLTLFAPTDEAFRRLPPGTTASLREPGNRDRLRRLLAFHLVEGRLLAADLLPASVPRTLAGPALPLETRIGGAALLAADIPCSNGVLHVLDGVRIPPGDAPAGDAIREAIEAGAPLFNAGDPAACADLYARTARELLGRDGALGELQAEELAAALEAPTGDEAARAWALRGAFDSILADESFRPLLEAPLPEGFPGPGPVGRVLEKRYPGYRAARAAGGGAFFTLFNHIRRNRVAMTAPVEMTMDEGAGTVDMAFLYGKPGQGEAGEQGAVSVLDLPARRVLSLGMRGSRPRAAFEGARRAILARMERDGLEADGPFRVLGYNSPMVPPANAFWEVQVPVRAR